MGGGSWSNATYRAEAASVPKEERYRGDREMQQTGHYKNWLNPSRKPFFESRDIDGLDAMDITLIHDLTGSTAIYREETFVGLPHLNQGLSQWNRHNEQLQVGIWGIADYTDPYELQIGEYEADVRMAQVLGELVKQSGGDEPEGYLAALWARANYVRADALEKRGLKGHTYLVLDEEGHPWLEPSELEHAFGTSMIQKRLSPKQVGQMALAKTHLFVLQLGKLTPTVTYWNNALGTDTDQSENSRVVQLVDPKFIAHTAAAVYALTEGARLTEVEGSLISEVGERQGQRITESVSRIPMGEQLKLRSGELPTSGPAVEGPGWL